MHVMLSLTIYLHRHRHAGSLPLKLAYDHEVDATGDPLIQKVEEAMAVLAQIMMPGTFLVNSFPCCELFLYRIENTLVNNNTHLYFLSRSESLARVDPRYLRVQKLCQAL